MEIPEGIEVQTSPKCKPVYNISPEVVGNRALAGRAEVQPGVQTAG